MLDEPAAASVPCRCTRITRDRGPVQLLDHPRLNGAEVEHPARDMDLAVVVGLPEDRGHGRPGGAGKPVLLFDPVPLLALDHDIANADRQGVRWLPQVAIVVLLRHGELIDLRLAVRNSRKASCSRRSCSPLNQRWSVRIRFQWPLLKSSNSPHSRRTLNSRTRA